MPNGLSSSNLSHQTLSCIQTPSLSLSLSLSLKSDPSMETSLKFQENQNPSLIRSPNSHSTNTTSSSSSNSSSNGLHHHHHHHPSSLPPPPPTPTTPKPPITRSEPNNPYPTTFVQADTSSFKQVVQMLTGSSETAKLAAANKSDPPKNPIPPIKTGPKKQPSSKLYERRNSLKNFKISPLVPGLVHGSEFSPRKPEILSPSILDFPSLVLSPVTPLIPDPFNRSPNLNMDAEKQAIAKKGFYLHPSPASTPRDSEPRLLPLFPVTSPRVSGSS
ncbi:VQ motif-containing protein 4 [Camellia lanceoleosa]|uniref:VQ motif-containing protein 4 n=1 Tax=Camellia lanceoleosa TaxID=1840588 RepID=A0ACC0GMD2_9ERIC|nr:VQ motif-containing protein 4 [Camellia lanceoleosa]